MEVWNSRREVPAHCWRKKKKIQIGHTEGNKRNSFTLPSLPLLPLTQGSIAQWQGRPSQPVIPSMGKSESMSLSTWLFSCVGHCQKGAFVPHPTQNIEC